VQFVGIEPRAELGFEVFFFGEVAVALVSAAVGDFGRVEFGTVLFGGTFEVLEFGERCGACCRFRFFGFFFFGFFWVLRWRMDGLLWRWWQWQWW